MVHPSPRSFWLLELMTQSQLSALSLALIITQSQLTHSKALSKRSLAFYKLNISASQRRFFFHQHFFFNASAPNRKSAFFTACQGETPPPPTHLTGQQDVISTGQPCTPLGVTEVNTFTIFKLRKTQSQHD